MRDMQESSTVSERQFKLKDLLSYTGMPKATYMYWQKRLDRDNPNAQLESKMLEIHTTHKDYDYRKNESRITQSGISGEQKESSKTDAEVKSSGNIVYQKIT